MNEQEQKEIRCHDNLQDMWINGQPRWQNIHDRLHCSFCGSLHPDEVKKIIEEGGKLGGADWKYGWPHKFYVYPKDSNDMFKWYNAHLRDMDDETLKEFSTLLLTHTGIEFKREEGKIYSYAPYYGYQR